jgi:hypothetical protein
MATEDTEGEVGNTALSLGGRVAIPQSRESQVRGYFVIFPRPDPSRACNRPLTRPAPAGENAGRRPPSPMGRGQRPNSLPFSSGNGEKLEVGPPCPAKDLRRVQHNRGGAA